MGAPELLQHLRGAGLALTVTDGGALHVAPRHALTDDLREAIRAWKPELVALLTPWTDESTVQDDLKPAPTCRSCDHLSRVGTCKMPVAAGLVDRHEICWPDPRNAVSCPAYSERRSAIAERPYRFTLNADSLVEVGALTPVEAERLRSRVADLLCRGFADQDAEDLAERLTIRDRSRDDRRMCLECASLVGDVETSLMCANAHLADVAVDLPVQLVTNFQRCAGFVTMPK